MTSANCLFLSFSLYLFRLKSIHDDLTVRHCTAFWLVCRSLAVISVHVFIFIPFRARTFILHFGRICLGTDILLAVVFLRAAFFLTIPVMFSLIRVAEDILLFSRFLFFSPILLIAAAAAAAVESVAYRLQVL